MEQKFFTINSLFFVLIIAVLTFWLTMVTAKGGLTNNRFRSWWKKYTKRGWQAIAIGTLIGLVLTLQEVNNQRISKNNEFLLKKEQNSRDSVITIGISKGVDRSTEKLFNNLSIAFKKQGLQYDTIKNQVLKLKDSIRITQINNETPLISLTRLEIKDSTYFERKTYKVEYDINSHDAKSLNIDLRFDIFAFIPNGDIRTIEKNYRVFYKGETIRKEEKQTNTLSIPKDNSYYLMYAFRLKGSYYSSDNKKIFIDKFYLLTPRKKTNYFGYPIQSHEDLLRAHLAKFYID
ncbi:hypothetical protein [Flavobacterium sp. MMS24-S5]|uniref:hypothetical protein n=1 Tax=Flavobacterium sp. MMS24-S5 TaxID=3416605 RepID=UPI003D0352C9